jgi:hypothetical protein
MVVLGDETKCLALIDHQHRGAQDTCFGSSSWLRRRRTSIARRRTRVGQWPPVRVSGRGWVVGNTGEVQGAVFFTVD